MKISSFDIFDTCLVRKCGTPENFFDILSLYVFNGEVSEQKRQEFVASRKIAQIEIQCETTNLRDIWDNFRWSHSMLKSKEELFHLEQEVEREMLVPVLSMRDKVNECRKQGDKIIFISDMYLSSDFLIDIMRRNGFYQDGDSLYVSCECGAMKWDGELFEYVRKQENLPSFRHWHHYGDNKQGDYNAPKNLGIKCTLINHTYTPYQQQWVDNDYSLGFKYPSILAGLGRALHYSTEWNTHTDFVLDIIAPFYCSLVYRMMKDAEQRGITRLYFCARDAYMMYLIAQKYAKLFPTTESRFLYISKKSLYEGDEKPKRAYFEQEGLITKTDKVAIVDFRSSGKTLHYLNEWMNELGAQQIRGYYFEYAANDTYIYFKENYYTEVNTLYLKNAPHLNRLLGCWSIYENFFPLNTLKRTIGYKILNNGEVAPIFDTEDESGTEEMERVIIRNKEYWSDLHRTLILNYINVYIQIAQYSRVIFEQCVTPCLSYFFEKPQKEYLTPLLDFYAYYWNDGTPIVLPYVRKCGLIRIFLNTVLRHKRLAIWKRGMLIYSIPQWLYSIINKIIH